jgi:hypothetical protein
LLLRRKYTPGYGLRTRAGIYTLTPDAIMTRRAKMKITDTDRLNWMRKQYGCGLISDDNGHWAVSSCGWQNVVAGEQPQDVCSTFVVDGKDWKNSLRKAIDSAMRET